MAYTVTIWSSISIFLLSISNAYALSQISYSVTIRDFLPIWCLNSEQYAELNITDPLITSQPDGGLLEDCPYAEFRERGEILGHPDFMRNPHRSGWDMGFLFDHEEKYGNKSFLSGTCDQVQLAGTTTRPPNLDRNFATQDCRRDYRVYSKRFNRTRMDISSAGIPKPQYCTSDPKGQCGYFFVKSGEKSHQSHTKYFQDMWYLDNRKYNKRIGSTLALRSKDGSFEFDSASGAENAQALADGHYAPHAQDKFVFSESTYPDPFLAPAWPQFNETRFPLKDKKKYLHTSEIHTFFQYRGVEKFTFSGDDDVWVYINGIMAIELGGYHRRVYQTIDLSNPLAAEYLGIEVGGIYTFDFFQAERNPVASNVKITTGLVSACNVADKSAGKLVFPHADGNSFRHSRSVKLDFVDGDVYKNEPISLLHSGSSFSSSFIFAKEQINVGAGFQVKFTFVASGEPEGFAFVLHRRPEGLKNFPINSGANLGFKGATHSVAVAFDLCSDRSTGNCIMQQVSIQYPSAAAQENGPDISRRRVFDPILLSLRQGDEHEVRIDYFFKPKAMEVTIDDSLYLREFPFDAVKAFGSTSAFAGFTGSSSARDGSVNITSWSMRAVDVDSRTTGPVDFETSVEQITPKSVIADGDDQAGYSIQTKDYCGGLIGFGGRDVNTGAVYIEERDASGLYSEGRSAPLILDAEIKDHSNGIYSYSLNTVNTGTFSLYLFYGDRDKACTFNVSASKQKNAPPEIELGVGISGAINLATEPQSTPDGCFYGIVKSAVVALPATHSPTTAPSVLMLDERNSNEAAIMVGAIGGAVIGLGAAVALTLNFAYRRRWKQQKRYIADGEAYMLHMKTSYKAKDQLTKVGRELLESRASILQFRSHTGTSGARRDIFELQTDCEELKEQIRVIKQSAETVVPFTDEHIETGLPKLPPRSKLEF